MTEQAERMVLDYLSKVADLAYGRLPSRRRAGYLADLRSRIMSACEAAGAERPEDVERVLAGFGAPGRRFERDQARAEGDAEEEPERAVDRRLHPTRSYRPAPWKDQGAAGGGAPAVLAPPSVLVTVLRSWVRRPAEAASIAVYLFSGIIGPFAFAWVVGAAMVGLSPVWTRRDKWIAVGVPIAATLTGMLLWQPDVAYIYADQFIQRSLAETGVLGLRVAAVLGAVYLTVRLPRAAGTASGGESPPQ
ncbi:hypothetical protein ACFOVU_21570 [Nocardiopsis sediminis]|uniref:Integral membrane protein n=1 Tax=Nocardiopsis sediminis TaxID=1778267 RepID=A0ABV8FQW4_9ACTN